MRLLLIHATADTAEAVADRCWQAGAAGIWEQAEPGQVVELRVGVDDLAAPAFLTALADLGPTDVTDAEAVELATRTVTVTRPGRDLTFTVPPTVFGDGAHPTTRACIAALDELVAVGAAVLDVGCGSGMLAVVAADRGARVRAIDVDPAAVAATRANATANGVEVVAEATDLVAVDGRYDVIAANISAGTLLELADDLVARLDVGGRVVVSGILAQRWDEVADRFGGEVLQRRETDGWVTAVIVPGR